MSTFKRLNHWPITAHLDVHCVGVISKGFCHQDQGAQIHSLRAGVQTVFLSYCFQPGVPLPFCPVGEKSGPRGLDWSGHVHRCYLALSETPVSIARILSEDILCIAEVAVEVEMQPKSEVTSSDPMDSSCLISNILGALDMFSCQISGARLEAILTLLQVIVLRPLESFYSSIYIEVT